MFLRSHQNFQQIQLTQDLLRGPKSWLCRALPSRKARRGYPTDSLECNWSPQIGLREGFLLPRKRRLCEEFETKPPPSKIKRVDRIEYLQRPLVHSCSFALPSDFEDSGVLNRSSFSRKMDHHPWLKIAPPISVAGPSASKKKGINLQGVEFI